MVRPPLKTKSGSGCEPLPAMGGGGLATYVLFFFLKKIKFFKDKIDFFRGEIRVKWKDFG
jgi:hypothetical protein